MTTNTDIKTISRTPQLQLGYSAKALAESLASVNKLTVQIAAQRPLAKWAEEQQRSLTGLQRALTSAGKPGSLGIAAALGTRNKSGAIGAAAVLGKRSNLGTLGFGKVDVGVSSALAKSLVGFTPPRYPSALRTALIEPSTRYSDLARALAPSLRTHRTSIASPSLRAILRKQTFTFPELIDAGKNVAALIEHEGAGEKAVAVRKIAAEVAEVAATPTTTTVERLATALSAQLAGATAQISGIDSKVEDLSERVDENERKRQSDDKMNTSLAFYLWYLALMVEVVRLILEVAAKGQ